MDTIEIIESFLREYFLYGAIITPIITIILMLYHDDDSRREVLKGGFGLIIVTAIFLLTAVAWFFILPSIVFMGIVIGTARIIERIKNPPVVENT